MNRVFARMSLIGAAMLLLVSLIGPSAAQDGQRIDPDRPTVLVTGANRGIGLALAQHYLGEGWNVLAAVRTPSRAADLMALAEENEHLLIEQLDVTDEARIAELADAYRGTSIDLLINNAGIYGDIETQSWGSLSSATFEQVMAVNVFAPMKLAEAFAGHVAASDQRKIVSITSGAGVVSREGRPGGGIIYGTSKAALNKAMREISAEVSNDGIIVALIAPGIVATDMLSVARPGLVAQANTPAEAAAGIADVIAGLDESYDGRPRNYDGSVIPW